MKYLDFIKANPVLVMDAVKAALAIAVYFGLPVSAGLAAPLAVLVYGALSVATRGMVVPVAKHDEAVEEALYTPVPDPDATQVQPRP